MNIKNYTPHPIVIVDNKRESIADLPSEGIARVASKSVRTGAIMGIPLTRATYGEVTGLPEQESGVWLIVSRMVAAASPDRRDLLVPGELVRDESGAVIGCQSLEVPS